jgi:hypothetical protein
MIPANSVRVVLTGHLPGSEQFNTGFWLHYVSGMPQTDDDAKALSQRLATAVATPIDTLKSIINTASGYDAVRVYLYPTAGTQAFAVGETTLTGKTGTGSSGLHPLQTALVATLRTGYVGRRKRGRMYLPANAVSLSAPNNQMSTSDTDAQANAVAAMLQAANNLADDAYVAVISQVGSGDNSMVTEVRVDSRLDVQQRRADSQAATYQKIVAVNP